MINFVSPLVYLQPDNAYIPHHVGIISLLFTLATISFTSYTLSSSTHVLIPSPPHTSTYHNLLLSLLHSHSSHHSTLHHIPFLTPSHSTTLTHHTPPLPLSLITLPPRSHSSHSPPHTTILNHSHLYHTPLPTLPQSTALTRHPSLLTHPHSSHWHTPHSP